MSHQITSKLLSVPFANWCIMRLYGKLKFCIGGKTEDLLPMRFFVLLDNSLNKNSLLQDHEWFALS